VSSKGLWCKLYVVGVHYWSFAWDHAVSYIVIMDVILAQ
jgi:hypothetical protein